MQRDHASASARVGSLGRLRLPVALSVLALLCLGGYGLLEAQERRRASSANPKARDAASASTKLWFFFSTSQKNLQKEVARLRTFLELHPEIAFRPCVLVEDFAAIKKPTKDFAATLRELGAIAGTGFSMPVWDAEGVNFAQRLRIRRLPAYALVTGTTRGQASHRAHLAFGRGVDFRELMRCR